MTIISQPTFASVIDLEMRSFWHVFGPVVPSLLNGEPLDSPNCRRRDNPGSSSEQYLTVFLLECIRKRFQMVPCADRERIIRNGDGGLHQANDRVSRPDAVENSAGLPMLNGAGGSR
jgi:hypothetical protein